MAFFVPPDRRQALRERLRKLLCVPFSFSTKGSHVVLYEPEELYDQSLAKEPDAIYGQNSERARLSEVEMQLEPRGNTFGGRGSGNESYM